MRLTQLAERDLSPVAAAWNAALVHDQVTEEQFRRVVFDDPNYEPEGCLVAKGEDGSVLGLAACVLRRDAKGKDGRGRESEFGRGFLKGFFVVESEEGDAAARALLEGVESYCVGAGKDCMLVTEYAGAYVFPGMDVRYGRLMTLLADNGYQDSRTIEDVGVSLSDPGLSGLLQRARIRVGPEVEIMRWRPGLLPAMRRFVEEGDQPQWFPKGWEKRFSVPRETALVLRKQSEILGWAQYWPGELRAGFGPILVLARERGKGYGSLLLLECMTRARNGGTENMEAGWANTGFYVANGWHITRRYAVLAKELGQGDKG